MDLRRNRVASALLAPESLQELDSEALDLLIRQARRAMLLPRLGYVLMRAELLHSLPEQIRRHILSEYAYFEKQNVTLNWEIDCLHRVLQPLKCELVLLKGAAYALAGNEAASGRLFSDVDILVPEVRLAEVESALKQNGWVSTHQNPYDQRYYREWMHELPPMIHLKRHSSLDVHHNILPRVGRICPDASRLLEQAEPVAGSGCRVLSAEDRVIHSAVHLMHDGELDHGFRDLVDLDSLLREFACSAGFWDRLVGRIAELELGRPLFYALRYTRMYMQTPVPREVCDALHEYAPRRPLLGLMDFLFLRALMPDHSSCDDLYTGTARWMLFVRAHWLRMPAPLLIRHLLKKFLGFSQQRQSLKKR